MNFTKQLPPKFIAFRKFDFTRDSSSYMMVNVLMALLLLLFYYIFSMIVQNIVPEFEGAVLGGFTFWEVMIVFVLAFVMMFLHEGIHFFVYKTITGTQPEFAAKSANPHTRMPEVYFGKWLFVLVKLIPLVVLTLVFLAAAPIIPLSWMTYAIFFFAGNAAFSASDLITITQVMRVKGEVLVEDLSDVVIFYTNKA